MEHLNNSGSVSAYSQLVRYTLWFGLLVSANANRKHSGLVTAWAPHLIGNTLSLLLPDICRATGAALQVTGSKRKSDREIYSTLGGVLHDVVLNNPRYAEYVAPAAVAYIFSHPAINIYKSAWANRQIFGFGLDSIPHAWTAFGLTRLVFDTVNAFKRHAPAGMPLAWPTAWAESHAGLVSALVIAAASAFYESGEYLIHVSELKAVHNDPAKIEMQWSLADTIQDLISNAAGWLLAVLTSRH